MNYEKVNWTTGEKVREGYVIIDGVTYQTVQPEYSGNTPVNVENLNHMDEQIETLSEDYIEETGTNYIKYSSGKMICWDTYSGTVNVTSSAGGVYYSTHAFTFPQEFTSTPIVIPSVTQNSGVLWAGLGNASTQTATGTQLRVIAGASTSNASVTFNYVAIGKWQ